MPTLRWNGPGWAPLAAVIAVFLLACNGEAPPTPTLSPAATPSPTPTAEPTATPTLTPTATPTPTLGPAAFDLLYREFGETADTIWRVDPANPQEREAIATIGHALGFESFPSLSPQGDAIAYTVLPEGARGEPLLEGRAFIMPIGGEPKPIADKVDARRIAAPLWSPDGKFIYLRRNTQDTLSLIQVELETGEERSLFFFETSHVFELSPIGLSGDGQTLYFTTISGQGTFFGRYSLKADRLGPYLEAATGAPARDWTLSPDGGRIAYLAPVLVGGRRTFVADLATREVTLVDSPAFRGTGHLRPLWHPQGQALTIGQLPDGDEPSPALVIDVQTGEATSLSPPEKGFDEPWSWSPDGQFLAVRSFEGTSLANPGRMRLMFIASGGQRLLVAEGVAIVPVGWI